MEKQDKGIGRNQPSSFTFSSSGPFSRRHHSLQARRVLYEIKHMESRVEWIEAESPQPQDDGSPTSRAAANRNRMWTVYGYRNTVTRTAPSRSWGTFIKGRLQKWYEQQAVKVQMNRDGLANRSHW